MDEIQNNYVAKSNDYNLLLTYGLRVHATEKFNIFNNLCVAICSRGLERSFFRVYAFSARLASLTGSNQWVAPSNDVSHPMTGLIE